MTSTNQSFIEMIIFCIVMTITGFAVSYATDLLYDRPIVWVPPHAKEMASGTFLTSMVVFHLFSHKYVEFKCENVKNMN